MGQLVGALESAKVCSRRGLAEAWSSKPNFLKEELLGWIRKGRGAVLDAMWPVMLLEARADGAVTAARKRKKSLKTKAKPSRKLAMGAADSPVSRGSSGGEWAI